MTIARAERTCVVGIRGKADASREGADEQRVRTAAGKEARLAPASRARAEKTKSSAGVARRRRRRRRRARAIAEEMARAWSTVSDAEKRRMRVNPQS
eukprot:6179331-Pleurochrysis_carterae.AAC.1